MPVLSLSSSFTSKVVMVSGYNEEESRARFLALGAHEYIVKPIEFNKLFDMFNMLYKKSERSEL